MECIVRGKWEKYIYIVIAEIRKNTLQNKKYESDYRQYMGKWFYNNLFLLL